MPILGQLWAIISEPPPVRRRILRTGDRVRRTGLHHPRIAPLSGCHPSHPGGPQGAVHVAGGEDGPRGDAVPDVEVNHAHAYAHGQRDGRKGDLLYSQDYKGGYRSDHVREAVGQAEEKGTLELG